MPKRTVADRRINSEIFQQRTQPPGPSIAKLETQLYRILSPIAFTPLRTLEAAPVLRDRILTLPVMTAVVFSLVLRGIASLREAQRLLLSEGLMWAKLQSLGHSALSERLRTLPAEVFEQMLQTLIAHYQSHAVRASTPPQTLEPWQQRVAGAFTVVWTSDASTLDAMRRTTTWMRQNAEAPGDRLGGMMHAVVESFTSAPVSIVHQPDSQGDELDAIAHLLRILPEQGLVVLDEGYFQFDLFDRMSDQGKFFLTRMRKQVRYNTLRVLEDRGAVRDEIIEVGLHRSHPCRHRLRLVTVRWNGATYTYVTNVLDPERLSAEDLVHLYRTRWRIEMAFKQIKRLLGLSYLWVGHHNGVRIQIAATWIIYTVLVQLQSDLAEKLGIKRDRLSFEMIYRSLYHYSRALDRAAASDLLSYLAENARMLGLIKEQRKHQRQHDQQWAALWGYT
jgi:hypothetical protein